MPKHSALAHPWEKCPGRVLSSQARSRGDRNVLALNLLSALLCFLLLSSHSPCPLASLSFISVLPVKLWPHYTLYQLCLCPKIRLWNPFPQVKLHLTLAVSCVLTRYYCKQFEIPRMASCKSHWTDPSIAVHTVSENTTWSVTKDKLWQPQTIFTTFVTTSLGQCPSNPSAQRSHVGDSSPQSKLVTQGTAKYNPFGICFLPLALIHML